MVLNCKLLRISSENCGENQMFQALQRHNQEIYNLLMQEKERQNRCIRLIPSENYVSKAVMEATGSCITNKYAEGYPGRRYYEGQQITDQIETIAADSAKKLFGSEHANVQPYSGSIANLAAYVAFLKPGDTVMGLALPYGGHLTHGWNVSATGLFFNSIQYQLDPATGRFDYDKIADHAKKHKPRLIVSGATAYTREIDFEAFGRIAKSVGAYHLSDVSHIAGLIAGDAHPSPVPHADAVSSTTHKSLRGPRGAMILCPHKHRKIIDRAVFPGLQGGPHMHTIAGIAVAMAEAATPQFAEYARQVVKNAKRLAEKLLEYGFNLISGGTDNHLILIDLRNKNMLGKKLSKALDRANIVANYNTIPADPAPPFNPSGLRVGPPALTTRRMKETEMEKIAQFIDTVAQNVDNEDKIAQIGAEVADCCAGFPVPDNFT